MKNTRWLRASFATLAALPLLLVGAAHAQTQHHHAAKKDPCFFTKAEWENWWNGPRWGTDLSVVQNQFAGCPGVWDTFAPDDWKGNPAKVRVWAQQNGGTLDMTFVWNNGVWNANDTSSYNIGTTDVDVR